MFSEMLEIAPGQVRSFLWDGSVEAWSKLTWPDALDCIDARLVIHKWDQLPSHEGIIHSVLRTLSEVAYCLWPHWYGMDNLFSVSSIMDANILNFYQSVEWKKHELGISLPWLKAVVKRQQQNQLPLLPTFPRAIQYAQLIQAIHPKGLLLVLVLTDKYPPEQHLHALAQVAPWIASHTQARVALCLPHDFTELAALDKILYKAQYLRVVAECDADPKEQPEEAIYQVFPIQGKPHPFSPGEQKLARNLEKDSELNGLFCFNRIVKTIHHQSYIVDLLWPEARLIVEVDGYRHHGNRYGFAQDRQRDYELLISDYIVLRLPHEAVIQDVELEIEKIRSVVHFRRQQLGLTH